MSKYGMTPEQIEAAKNAMNGVLPNDVMMLILFVIGVIATVWLLLNFIGLDSWRERNKKGIGDIALQLGTIVAIWIVVGSLIFY